MSRHAAPTTTGRFAAAVGRSAWGINALLLLGIGGGLMWGAGRNLIPFWATVIGLALCCWMSLVCAEHAKD